MPTESLDVTSKKIKVWDLPTRLFHWSMVCLLGLLWWSAEEGEMLWHQIFAYSLIVLILFRLVWGVIGSDTARFTHFIKSPKEVLQYLKQRKKSTIGHNPLGGYMVITLIVVMLFQFISGLFATDDVFTEGPLYSYVSDSVSSTLTSLHKLNFDLIIALATMHILAVIIHGIKGDKLVGAMITGHKYVADDIQQQLNFRSNLLAFVLICLLAGVVANYLILPLTAML
ncbi:cytochrome b/b6 domain-containing protein [Shewanella sp. Isolate11]|uniref:cytochrome b/b6 domain-containing protein n=1 Tax=Shewanella sp. Isolate11 TaxID=2908530 RepID=UPI001EFCA817|nr:cytochrome b/b6 domain-containing protein [Shewanella sp. Isolate11]MCG9695965.1 cytochrome b/b6 domain-containing protein [Shewanella sp. Isolate11]